MLSTWVVASTGGGHAPAVETQLQALALEMRVNTDVAIVHAN